MGLLARCLSLVTVSGMSRFAKTLFTLASLALIACGDEDGSLRPGATAYGKSISSGTDPSTGGSRASSGGDTSGSAGSGSSGSAGSGSSGASGSDAGTADSGSAGKINAYRKTVGSPALTRWNAEEKCSDGQAQSDSKSGAAHGAFGMCGEYGQNECPGWPGPAGDMIPSCLKAMWGEGPGGGHYENMKATRYTQVSCGFYTLADGSVWAVQNFR